MNRPRATRSQGFLARNWPWTIAAGLLVIILYGGSMLTGVLPLFPGISWQGHLFGAIGGGLAAWIAGQPRWRSLSGETTAPRRTGGLY